MEIISVIIPVYNVERYLARCIESVQKQTYRHLEIILVDDGSTDHSMEICDQFAEKDSRIKVIHKKNGGLSSARNVGLELSRGEYIFFVDSDDYIDGEAFCTLIEQIKLFDADIAMCQYLKVDENGKALEKETSSVEKVKLLTGKQLLIQNSIGSEKTPVVVWNKLYKREIFKQLRFDEGKQHEDEFIFHKICFQCDTIVSIQKNLYFYTQRENSIMGKGISSQSVDALEAYLRRILSIHNIEEPEIQRACDNTIKQFYYTAFVHSRRLGFDNMELNEKMKKLRKEVFIFLPILLKSSSQNWKEKIEFGSWLLSPRIYGNIRGEKNVEKQ